MATYDFQGGDVTASGGQYGASTTHTSTFFTEGGIDFTFTSNAPVALPQAGFAAITMLGTGYTPGAPLIGTLNVVDTDFGQTFLSNMNVAFDYVGPSGGTPLQFTMVFSNTVTGGKSTVSGTWAATQSTFSLAPTNSGALYNKITFTVANGYVTVDNIEGNPNCFMPGTQIATEHGTTAVEDLKPGDKLRTKDGGLTEVTWLGTQKIDTRLQHPAKVNPVCISAGALGAGVPERDLFVSADHAVEIDGTLYNAGALVNGRSIYQLAKMPKEGFTYYHVETGAHELLLAEGVAAESFIDYVGRDGFDNVDEANPRQIAEMDLPRVSAARLVSQELRDRLLARADALRAPAAA